MDDLISRQAAIDAVYRCSDIFAGDMPVMVIKEDAYKALADLPSAQPERIKGRWQICGKDAKGHSDTFECSECGCLVSYAYYVPDCDYQFCPHCGADMRGEEDGSTD